MQRDFTRLIDQHFDVLVCGGGIYGAWTAYDAASRGLKVALIDQGDWACATSSASSKLIHGGLRYLESFDFRLVRKSLAERRMLLDAAPHRVWPLRFGIPVYRGNRIGSLRLAIGLTLYDWLAGTKLEQLKSHHYSSAGFSRRFPFLDPSGLTAGFTYLDAQTDDARFVLELIAGAQKNGAVCVNYCKASELLENSGKVCGAAVQDKVSGTTVTVHASQVVDTSGQWSSSLQKANPNYRLSKGVHLILPKTVETEALLLTAKSDGRIFFMIPWYGLTLIGTTDNNYNGDIEQVSIEAKEVDYLLTEANRVLKNVKWDARDIIGRYVGLRVLKLSEKESPSSISRDWELKISHNGTLTSIGGKFTSARADAECIVDRLCANLGLTKDGCTFGKPFPWLPNGDFRQWKYRQRERGAGLGIDSDSVKWLICRHGSRTEEVFQLCEKKPGFASRIVPSLPFIQADLVYCIRNEMVVHLEDLLRRRIPLLILAKIKPSELQQLAEITAKELNWTEDRMKHEYQICKQKWLTD